LPLLDHSLTNTVVVASFQRDLAFEPAYPCDRRLLGL
jgi:hypothetical protein